MRVKRCFKPLGGMLTVVLLLALMTTSVSAQVRGRITGRVTDAATGEYLPGANVILVGTTLGDATDREGYYTIYNVPPGTYTLKVSYIGYEDFTTQVTVGPAQPVVHQDAALKVSAVEVQAVVVEGMREGQMRALSQQRTAPNIMNVVAQEMIDRFPDENTADVLKRIPGVYIEASHSGGRFALIRGTSPRLNVITVNGVKLASNRNEERYPQLDIIGSSQLAFVQVIKAPTPDMDAGAIGGAINLVTLSAFDHPGRRLNIKVGSGYTEIEGKAIGEGRVQYSNVFGTNRNFGISLAANWDRRVSGTHGTEPEWDHEEDVNGNIIPFALRDVKLRDYNFTFERYGLSAGLEYRFGKQHRWFVRGLYSKFNDDELRFGWRARVAKGDYLNPEGTLTKKSRIVLSHKWRLEELAQYHLTAGGVHKWGNTQLDYTVAYSMADERHEPQYASEWELDEKVNLALDLSKPEAPKWTVTNLDEAYQFDPSHYQLDNIDYRNTYASNRHYTGAVNFKMPYSLAGYPAQLKLGAKVRFEKKDRDEDRWKYKWKGDTDVTLDQMDPTPVTASFFNGEYSRYAPELSEDKFESFFNQHKDELLQGKLRYWDSEGQWYVAKETVPAYYLMTTVNLGKVLLLAGFRHEFTKNDYQGTKLFFDEKGDFQSMERVETKRSYNNFLPMVHLKYQLGPWTQLRLAYTHGLARPNFWDLVPYFFVNPDDEEIRQGNPDLEPTTSKNVDVMFEHYFRGIGIAAAGFFYKNLDNIIFVKTSKVVGGVYDDFDLEMPVNGGSASLYGFELNWHQEFSFLPGFLSGFGIYANYTHTWSDADLVGRKGVVPGQAGDVGNLAVTYEKYGFSARLSFNYHEKFIKEVGKDEDYDEWEDERLQVDFSAAYDIAPWMQAYFEAINITNAPDWTYMGVHDRPIEVKYYSWRLKAGLKFNFGS